MGGAALRAVALADGIGRLAEDGAVEVLEAGAASLPELLSQGAGLAPLRGAPVRDRRTLGRCALGSVVRPGSAIWGIGMNYRSKQLATGRATPEHPVFFLKAPSALGAPGAPVVLPERAPACVDYEGEIAVLLARPLFEASPLEALEALAGVAVANDLTARDVMRETKTPSLAKTFPGFAQLGAVLAEPDALGGIEAIEIRTRVNGELRQDDTGAGMLLDVGALLSLLSRYVRLEAGDVVLTGTPAGTGDETGTYLRPGDVVEVTLAGLPPLETTLVGIASEPAPAPLGAPRAR